MKKSTFELKDLRKSKTMVYSKYIKISVLMISIIVIALIANIKHSNEQLSISNIGTKIEKSKILGTKEFLEVDYLNDYRFEGIVNYIDDIYAIAAADTSKTQDIFIIKSSKPDLVQEHFNEYKNSINSTPGKEKKSNNSSDADMIVGKQGDIVYLVSAANEEKIERFIKRYL